MDLTDKVQERYMTLLKEQDFIKIKTLEDLTGIKPNINEDMMQEAYAAYVKSEFNRWYIDMIEKDFGVSIRLSQTQVEELYTTYASKDDLHSIKSLKEYSKISPSEDIIKKIVGAE